MNSYIPGQDMIQNYIQNKLNQRDRKQLEIWLLDHPEVMQNIELDIMFKQGFGTKEEQGNSYLHYVITFLTSKRFTPIHVLAYTLVFFIMLSLINFDRSSSNSPSTFIELERQRGLSAPVIHFNTVLTNNIVFRIFPDSLRDEYSLQVVSKDKGTKLEFKKLKADDFGSITVTINDNHLNGQWEVVLLDSKNNKEQEYLLQVN